MLTRLATQWQRRAAGFIVAAAQGRDLGGHYYPGGIVSFGTLLQLWSARGGDTDTLRSVADFLDDKGIIQCIDERRGLISLNSSPGEDSDDPEMTGGGYFPEVVPMTTNGDYSHEARIRPLPTGLGGVSGYDWDVFDAYAVTEGRITSHIGRLLQGAA